MPSDINLLLQYDLIIDFTLEEVIVLWKKISAHIQQM